MTDQPETQQNQNEAPNGAPPAVEDERTKAAGKLADFMILTARNECAAAGRALTIDELAGRGLRERLIEGLTQQR